MSSVYIYSSTLDKRKEKAFEIIEQYNLKTTHPDLLMIQVPESKKSIGIDQVKEAIAFCGTKPFSAEKKVVLIQEADKLTPQAQNALLKILEEHSSNIEIILLGQTLNSVIPTILSRCKRIELKTMKDISDTYSNIFSLSTGERIALAEEISGNTNEEIGDIVKNWISILRKDITNPNFPVNTKYLLKALDDLEHTNMNKKLIVEWLLINLV